MPASFRIVLVTWFLPVLVRILDRLETIHRLRPHSTIVW